MQVNRPNNRLEKLTMNVAEYFEKTKGRGVLATADAEGRVDAAVYARPHVFDETTVAFIMRDRLSHANLQLNPHAAYLFMEDGGGYKGIRLFLTKAGEEKNTERLFGLRRKEYSEKNRAEDHGDGVELFLVTFKIDKILPLIGAGEEV
jgi:hypothetical protein